MKLRWIAAVPLTFLASGCGGGDDGTKVAEYTPGNILMDLLGIPSDPVESRRQELAVQDAIAECMRAQGFEYVPFDRGGAAARDAAWGSLEYGEQYAYGVMRNYELSGGSPYLEPVSPDVVDPNDEIVASLSSPDQRAYRDARYGDSDNYQTVVDADGNELTAPTLDQQGCEGEARLDVVGVDRSADPEISALLEQFYAPQVEAQVLTTKWAECVEPVLDDLGLDYELRLISDGYRVAASELFGALGLEIIETSSPDEAATALSAGEWITAWTYDGGVGYYVLAKDVMRELTGRQIDGLIERELALWAADYSCQDEVGYRDYLREREQAVVDQILAVRPRTGELGAPPRARRSRFPWDSIGRASCVVQHSIQHFR